MLSFAAVNDPSYEFYAVRDGLELENPAPAMKTLLLIGYTWYPIDPFITVESEFLS